MSFPGNDSDLRLRHEIYGSSDSHREQAARHRALVAAKRSEDGQCEFNGRAELSTLRRSSATEGWTRRPASQSRRYRVQHVQRRAILWALRAESAHEIGHQAYRQDQAKPAAADDGAAKVKPAAAEQEK